MCKLGDKDYWQVGDNVYSMSAMKLGTIVRISLDPDKLKVQYKDKSCDSYYENGNFLEGSNRTLFHQQAITFDEEDRPIAINYDYVPEREPKVMVTKIPHEFVKGEKVLVRDGIDFIWKPSNYKKCYIGRDFPYIANISNWRYCIPYKGNEHCVGKITNCQSGKIPDDYVFPKKERVFKPFDKVFVKEDSNTGRWFPALYAYNRIETVYDEYSHGTYERIEVGHYIIGNETDYFTECIPFEGNEHLLGTNNHPN